MTCYYATSTSGGTVLQYTQFRWTLLTNKTYYVNTKVVLS